MVGGVLRRVAVAATVLVAAATLSSCGGYAPSPSGPAVLASPTPAPRTGVPQLRADVVARGLNQVADVGFLPDGKMLVAQLGGQFSLVSGTQPGAAIAPVQADLGDVYVRGDAGLMGLAVHPDFAQTRRFTTCQTHADRGVPTDVRLVTWELASDGTSARRVVDPLVGGLPVNTTGLRVTCRPTIAADGALLVGTGDSQRAGVAQDLGSLGGKILRIDLSTGGPPLGNPFAAETNPAQQLILNFGHTDVTGIAIDPRSGNAYSAEIGSTVDDEVNLVAPGANYGWDPSRGGLRTSGYDLTVPMTDLVRYPTAIPALWSAGKPAIGISGAAFIKGAQWGDLDGQLAVSADTAKKLLIMAVGADGKIGTVTTPPVLTAAFGELTSVRTSPDGGLFVTTGNGTDDKVVRVSPT